MSRELNCPNCGAPRGMNNVCEYCGTHFERLVMEPKKQDYNESKELTLYQLNFIRVARSMGLSPDLERKDHE